MQMVMMPMLGQTAPGRTASSSCRQPDTLTQPNPWQLRAPRRVHQLCSHALNIRQPHRTAIVPSAIAPESEPAYVLQLEEDGEEQIINRYRRNIEPDYSDPEWYEKVTDWGDFWNFTRWDSEIEDLDDSYDTAGRSTYGARRAVETLMALRQIEALPDAINITIPMSERDHTDHWDNPPVDPEPHDNNPVLDMNDVRARAEKMRFHQLMDMEWKRRKAKIGAIQGLDPSRDVRLREFDYEKGRDDWTAEEVYQLITNNGIALRPEDHPGIVENPMIPVDMPNVMGVDYIEETDEFLARIGHLGMPEQIAVLDKQIIVDMMHGAPDNLDLVEEVLEDNLVVEDYLEAEEAHRAETNDWTGDEPDD